MKTVRRFVLVFVAASFFFGLAALAVPPPDNGGGNCNPISGQGRRRHCDPICGVCQQVVCDGTGWCKYHCEDIPGCVP
jgi:hypothetical protein